MMDEPTSILLVDDVPENLVALEAILDRPGWRLLKAYSGSEALRFLLTESVAVILMDVRMPIMDGLETASIIRQREKTRNIPIIFMTAQDSDRNDLFSGYLAGAVDYLSKPYDPMIILAKVSVFCDLYQQKAELALANLRLQEEIEERKRAEKEVARLNEELEARVLQRTAELDASILELESFSYSVSHDLRAPLRHISGFIALLKNKIEGHKDEKANHYCDRVTHAAVKMGRMIDALLDFSRMGRVEIPKIPVDLNKIIIDILSEFQIDLKDREICWIIDQFPDLCASEPLLKLVMSNLLSNALKFTRTRPQAEIRIRCVEEEDAVTCSIEDNGVGFDMNHAGRLFSVFQRLHGQEEFEGTGIGLANVKRIITRHEGKVWAQGTVGRGATFGFSLPKEDS